MSTPSTLLDSLSSSPLEAHVKIPSSLELPTPQEKLAYQLSRRQGLNDSEIAATLRISRETACRRRSRFIKKLSAIRQACPNACELLASLVV